MNFLFRFIVSVGLIITALTVLDLNITKGLLGNNQLSVYLDRNFNTTCLIMLKSQINCPQIKKVISGLLLSSGICIFLFKRKSVFLLAGLTIILWIAFYANPLIDKTILNFDWFLQAAVAAFGLFAGAFSLNN